MKNLLVLLAVGAMIAFTSCKKEFNCSCTPLASTTAYDKTGKGKDATSACNDAATKILSIPTEVCVPK